MQTLQQTYSPAYPVIEKKQSLLSQFISWCKGQEQYRFGWMAAIISIHACILAPLTLLTIALAGNNFVYWGISMGAFAMALISNLAAMPTKITIPVFFLSVILDLVVIGSSLAHFL